MSSVFTSNILQIRRSSELSGYVMRMQWGGFLLVGEVRLNTREKNERKKRTKAVMSHKSIISGCKNLRVTDVRSDVIIDFYTSTMSPQIFRNLHAAVIPWESVTVLLYLDISTQTRGSTQQIIWELQWLWAWPVFHMRELAAESFKLRHHCSGVSGTKSLLKTCGKSISLG